MAIRKGKSLCIFSAKGGVGKTTTACNLAGVYKLLNKKVLLVDLDLYGGGIALSLGKKFEKTIYDLAMDITSGKYNDFRDYVCHYNDNIDYLPAPKDPRCASKIDSRYIDVILDRSLYLYDIVIIDTNFILDEINLMTLDKVDSILFVVNNDPLDIKNMKSLISIFNELEIDKYKVLLNNSRDPYKDYFSLYDIKRILNANIDYSLSNAMYIKNIENYQMDGKILTLDSKFSSLFPKDYNTYMTICLDNIESGEKNEQD